MKKIRVGIIGLGVGYKHFEAYKYSKYADIKKIADFDLKKLKIFKKKNPKIIISNNASEITKDPYIDLVSIASHDEYHYEQIIESIKFKKNLFVEKPICLTLKQLNNIEKLINKHKINIESNFVLRTTELFKKISKISKNNKDLYFLEADYLWGRYKKLFGWRNKTHHFSLILGGAIHMIDLLCFILDMYPTSVTSYSNNIALKDTTFKNNTFYLIILKFKNGLIAKVSFNTNSNTKHFHQLKLYYKNKTLFHTPQGTNLFVKSHKVKNKLGNYPDKKSRKDLIGNYVKRLYKNNFKYKKNTRLFYVMRICFAAIKSEKQKKEIKINYGKN